MPLTIEEEAPQWPELQRQRRTLVVVDVVESVRLMQAHEDDVIDRWRRFVNEVRTDVLPALGGRMVKSLGDGMLLEFQEPRQAVAAAFQAQRRMAAYNHGRPADRAMQLRVGMHVAMVVMDSDDVFGSGVNLTARLATLARPGDVVASAELGQSLIDGLDANLEDLGECYLKHVDEPVRAVRLEPPEPAAASPHPQAGWHSHRETWDLVSLAVGSFADWSSNGLPSMVGNLVADELAAQLSAQPGLLVVSRLSTPMDKTHGRDPKALASALGVAYLAQGRLHVAGDHLVLSLDLFDGRDGSIVLSHRFRSQLTAVLNAQDAGLAEAVEAVVTALVRHEVRRAASSPWPHLKSYSMLLGALHLMHRLSAAEYQRAYEMLSYLIERHPESVTAKAWLAKWHVLRAPQGWSDDPKADAIKAQQLTRDALDRDPTHALSLAVEGFARAYFFKDHDGALERYDKAIACNANESLAWLLRSAILSYQGRTEEAIDSCARAQRTSPLDPMRYFYDHFSSGAYLAAGRYDEAVRYGERSRRANCTHASTLRVLAIAQMLNGQGEVARHTVSQLMSIEPGLTVSGFRARFPGKDETQVRMFGEALKEAGVPA